MHAPARDWQDKSVFSLLLVYLRFLDVFFFDASCQGPVEAMFAAKGLFGERFLPFCWAETLVFTVFLPFQRIETTSFNMEKIALILMCLLGTGTKPL